MFLSNLDRWIQDIIKSKNKSDNDISLASYYKENWEYNHVRDDVPIDVKQYMPIDIKHVISDLKSKGVTVDNINELYNTWIIYNDVRYLPQKKIYEMFYKKIKEYLNYINKRSPLIGMRAHKTERLTEGDSLSDYPYRLYESSSNIHTDFREIQKTIDSSYKPSNI